MRHIKMVVILLLYILHFVFICLPLFVAIIIGLEIAYTLKSIIDYARRNLKYRYSISKVN